MFRLLLKSVLYRLRGEYTTEQQIKMGMKIGINFKRLHGVILDPSHCWLIQIGDNVTIAPRVHILAHDASTCFSLGYAKIGRVIIGNNVFIGAESVVLPNVTIGDNVVIGANSTITKNLNANSVYAGNPAKFICSFEEYIEKNRKFMTHSPIFEEDYTLRAKINLIKKQKMVNSLRNNQIGYVK